MNLQNLKADIPIALLPVRLETRYLNNKLMIRVNPDDIHVNTHEPHLTLDEIEAGIEFKNTPEILHNRENLETAWTDIADRFGPERAAWIIKCVHEYSDNETFLYDHKKENSWTKAPETNVLPDHWIAIGIRGGQQLFSVKGNSIPASLPLGPNPDFEADADEGSLLEDEGLKWMIDYEEALNVGMAIEVPFGTNHGNIENGLDQLFVIGVKSAITSEIGAGASLENKGAETFKKLMEAHHYTSGLGIIRQGTPSNNTDGTPSGDGFHKHSYEDIIKRVFPENVDDESTNDESANDESNASKLAEAFGFFSNLSERSSLYPFNDVENALLKEQLAAKDINTALWAGTWEYYIAEMLRSTSYKVSLDYEFIEWLRQHFINHVRGRGPLPPIRIGNQPYGILPVTPTLSIESISNNTTTETEHEVFFHDLLKSLYPIWRDSLPGVPGIHSKEAPGKNLLNLLSLNPLSVVFRARSVLGPVFKKNLVLFKNKGKLTEKDVVVLNAFFEQSRELTFQNLKETDIPKLSPYLAKYFHAICDYNIGNTHITHNKISEHETLDDRNGVNYLSKLSSQDYKEIIKDLKENDLGFNAEKPIPLFYQLLRYSLLWEYAGEVLEYGRTPMVIESRTPEPELLKPFGEKGWNNSGLGYLINFSKIDDSSITNPRIEAVKISLENLSKQSTAELDRLLSECLDLSTHRLDAWVTSLATKRLKHLRNGNSEGLYIGGYGYIENLKPRVSKISEGFIHAPSLNHAATSAVLYNGYLSYKEKEGQKPLLIDLSSTRTQMALRLLEGVRQGQPLGALLGYQFERGLQNANLQTYILPFRKAFPLLLKSNNPDENDTEASESIAARNVVHGLKMKNRWEKLLLTSTATSNQKENYAIEKIVNTLSELGFDTSQDNTEHRKALIVLFRKLIDSIDALSDLLISESVHQVVQGNTMRAGATLEAVAAGEVTAPEMEVAKTPRTGISNTYRVATLFPTIGAVNNTSWNRETPMGKLQPEMENWVAQLLGDSKEYQFTIQFMDEDNNEVLSESILLSEINISTLDLVFSGEMGLNNSSEIELRILYAIQDKYKNDPTVDGTRLVLDFDAHLIEEGKLSFMELKEKLMAVQKLIANSRPLHPDDLMLPENVVEENVEYEMDSLNDIVMQLKTNYEDLSDTFKIMPGEVSNRICDTLEIERLNEKFFLHELSEIANLDALAKVFFKASFPGEAMDLNKLKKELYKLSFYDIENCILTTDKMGEDYSEEQLFLKICDALRQLKSKLDKIKAIEDELASGISISEKNRLLLEKVQLLFGTQFIFAPSFSLKTKEQDNLSQAFLPEKRSLLMRMEPLAVNTWKIRMSRVRKGFAKLNDLMFYLNAYSENKHPNNLVVSQISANDPSDDEVWIGVEKSNQDYLNGCVSIAIYQSDGESVDFTNSLCGLLIDEWVEVIPSEKETTGVAFHYDSPGSRPAQSVLLAISPLYRNEGGRWKSEHLVQSVLETIDLAKIRAVDSQSLKHIGHYLPALYFANNKEDDTTIKIDFKKELF